MPARRLAGFKVPAAWVRLDALPRTTGGKLRRDAVRALVDGEPAGQLARPGGDAIGWRVTGSGPRRRAPAPRDPEHARTARPSGRRARRRGDVTVHAIDRRGSGTSRLAEPRPLDVDIHVDDLVAYLDARGIDRGGRRRHQLRRRARRSRLAARLPDRVAAVVAYEPPYGPLADRETLAWFQRSPPTPQRAHDARGPAGAAETFLRAVAGDARGTASRTVPARSSRARGTARSPTRRWSASTPTASAASRSPSRCSPAPRASRSTRPSPTPSPRRIPVPDAVARRPRPPRARSPTPRIADAARRRRPPLDHRRRPAETRP